MVAQTPGPWARLPTIGGRHPTIWAAIGLAVGLSILYAIGTILVLLLVVAAFQLLSLFGARGGSAIVGLVVALAIAAVLAYLYARLALKIHRVERSATAWGIGLAAAVIILTVVGLGGGDPTAGTLGILLNVGIVAFLLLPPSQAYFKSGPASAPAPATPLPVTPPAALPPQQYAPPPPQYNPQTQYPSPAQAPPPQYAPPPPAYPPLQPQYAPPPQPPPYAPPPQAPQKRFCSQCGAPLNPGAVFCSSCGGRV